MLAGCVGVAALWMGVCTAAMMVSALSVSSGDQRVAETQAKFERLIADRQARLNSAVAQLSAANNSVDDLAATIEKRHAALALLLTDVKGSPGALAALTPEVSKSLKGKSPIERIQSVRLDQERLVAQAEIYAKTRAERLRLAFRLAGLNPATYAARGAALGGPLIEAKDPRALGAVLDVDPDFAQRIEHAASDMSDMRALSEEAKQLPFARPTSIPALSSSYGVRIDPFNHHPAFHSGLDFPGAMMTPIYATAPGVVSFTGVRSGYGNTVEIDHGQGFKTRYAHLAGIAVQIGQRVAVGQRVGAMGSTGRSTGPHLHYETWVDGKVQNPDRFLRAGQYVQQN